MGLTPFVLLIACTCSLTPCSFSRTAPGGTHEHRQLHCPWRPRGQLIRQLLSESLLLSLVGGALGLLVAYWGNMILGKGIGEDLEIDYRVVAFTLFASVATGIGFGLTPAWNASRTDVNNTLKQGVKGATADRSKHNLRNALVVCELALALGLACRRELLRPRHAEVLAPPDRSRLAGRRPPRSRASPMLGPHTSSTNDAQTGAAIDRMQVRPHRDSRRRPGVHRGRPSGPPASRAASPTSSRRANPRPRGIGCPSSTPTRLTPPSFPPSASSSLAGGTSPRTTAPTRRMSSSSSHPRWRVDTRPKGATRSATG